MSDEEKGKPELADPGEDAAATKLWAVYISEAEKYDKSLVESWKSDMEGMLIFAGLFSASLTAFLIESYKTLSPDSGDQTVKLLAQISQQLASGSNGTAFPISPAPTFTPSSTSLICNALWFISLGLSLTCALIATLLEQWARDFIHRADMRSAPLIRARIYSYLYYGMRRFNMHAIVDIIPLFLHASLLFFFAGLIAFLIPVNIIMTAIVAVLFVLVTTIYTILTFLPLRYTDCPYRTPLSGAFWPLFQRLRIIWTRRLRLPDAALNIGDSVRDETVVEVMTRNATEDAPARKERDYHALVWTVKSLADDSELEPFVDALPNVLWGQKGQRQTYCDHIRRLANHRDVQLCSRIDDLYASTTQGILSSETSKHRQISCYKALWAVASTARVVSSQTPGSELAVDFHSFRTYAQEARDRGELTPYAISAQTMMEWSTFCAINVGLEEHERYLVQYLAGSSHTIKPPAVPTSSFLKFATEECGFRATSQSTGPFRKWSPILEPPEQLIFVQSLRNSVPHSILFRYLCNAARLDSAPYRWKETCATIRIDGSTPFAVYGELLNEELDRPYIADWDYSSLGPQYYWGDAVVTKLASFWKPMGPEKIPLGLLTYMTHRHSVLPCFLSESGIRDYVWPCIRPTLDSYYELGRALEMDFNHFLWALAFWATGAAGDGCEYKCFTTEHSLANTCYTDALQAMSHRKSFFSTIAIVKLGIVNGVDAVRRSRHIADDDLTALLRHGIFPPDTERSMRDRVQSYEDIMDAKLYVLMEFLEYCSSAKLPYRAAETVEKLTIDGRDPWEGDRNWRSLGSGSVPVHSVAQLRFASSVHAVFARAKPRRELLDAIVRSELLDGYAGVEIIVTWGKIRGHPWITDPTARQTLTEAFTGYEATLAADPDPPKGLFTRLRAILNGFSTMHPDPDPQPDDATVDADNPKATQERPESVPPEVDSPEDAV
ncbi:hypothetical protein DFH06DRAFT_401009 [Mycena polygramma]|nr:hypothetical protein DFH06DRAFT_401009 [Mycena polygramma]